MKFNCTSSTSSPTRTESASSSSSEPTTRRNVSQISQSAYSSKLDSINDMDPYFSSDEICRSEDRQTPEPEPEETTNSSQNQTVSLREEEPLGFETRYAHRKTPMKRRHNDEFECVDVEPADDKKEKEYSLDECDSEPEVKLDEDYLTTIVDPETQPAQTIYLEDCTNNGYSSAPLTVRLMLSERLASSLKEQDLDKQCEVKLVKWGRDQEIQYLNDSLEEVKTFKPKVERLAFEDYHGRRCLLVTLRRRGSTVKSSDSLPLSECHGWFPFHFKFEFCLNDCLVETVKTAAFKVRKRRRPTEPPLKSRRK